MVRPILLRGASMVGGAAWSPLSLTTLRGWWRQTDCWVTYPSDLADAAGEAVNEARDLSGNGKHLTNGTKPVIVLAGSSNVPCPQFNGSSQSLYSATSTLPNDNAGCLWALVRVGSTNHDRIIVGMGASGSSTRVLGLASMTDTGAYYPGVRAQNGTNTELRMRSTTAWSATNGTVWDAVILTCDGTDYKLYVNGTTAEDATTGAITQGSSPVAEGFWTDDETTAFDVMTTGARAPTFGLGFGGVVADWGWTGSLPSAGDISSLSAYLQACRTILNS